MILFNNFIACKKIYFFTTKAKKTYADATYDTDEVFLMFGKETKGLPEDLLAKYRERCLRIPIRQEARSLNLSNAVAITVFEALRQLDFPGLQDFGKMRETDSETIGSWHGPILIVLNVEDSQRSCTITLAQVPARIDGAFNRIYRLGLAFETGEEYAYTGDDPSQLPLAFFAELPKGAVVPEGEGIEAVFMQGVKVLENNEPTGKWLGRYLFADR